MMALTILITGGIGSGKSVVSGILRALGIPVYDTDSRTKALYEGELGMRLEEDLGQKLHTADGHFDRKADCLYGICDCFGKASVQWQL